MIRKIKQAANILEKGGIICFPTETVFALAANSYDKNAVERIYKIKGRDTSKLLAVLTPDIGSIERIAVLDDRSKKIVTNYSPGPVTYILPRNDSFLYPTNNNPGLRTIAVRIPDNEIAQAILKAANCPVVATSANISGDDAAINSDQVKEIFGDKVDLIIEGSSNIGIASTIVDLCSDEIKIIRKGSINITK